jgi:hypothetical protein
MKHKSRRSRVFAEAIRSIPLIDDDLFLGMQAFNLGVVDELLKDWETQLLARLIEEEKTPMPDAIYVSAISQLWAFGVYELLRTWRQRARDVLAFADSIKGLSKDDLEKRLSEKKVSVRNASADPEQSDIYYNELFVKATKDIEFVRRLRKAVDHSELPFRRLESLRVHLAKHEIPRLKGSYGMAPGYGRIDMLTGSFYWQVPLGKLEVDLVSRRSIADSCLEILSNRTIPALSPELQKVVRKFPEHHYGIKYVMFIMKDGLTCKAHIAWNRLIVHVKEYEGPEFRAENVVEIKRDLDPSAMAT